MKSVRTSKRTPHFTTTKINLLKLLWEIITVYTENDMKPINAKWTVTDCSSSWFCPRIRPYGISGDNVLLRQVFLQVLRFSSVNITPPCSPYSYITWRIHNRSVGGRSSET
jgi:hypothetical protein